MLQWLAGDDFIMKFEISTLWTINSLITVNLRIQVKVYRSRLVFNRLNQTLIRALWSTIWFTLANEASGCVMKSGTNKRRYSKSLSLSFWIEKLILEGSLDFRGVRRAFAFSITIQVLMLRICWSAHNLPDSSPVIAVLNQSSKRDKF